MVTYGYDTATAANNCDTSVSSLNTTIWDSCTIKSNIATATSPSITISADEITSYVRS